MGPRELVLNPKVSPWRHPAGAVKANRPPAACNERRCSRLLLIEPLGRRSRGVQPGVGWHEREPLAPVGPHESMH